MLRRTVPFAVALAPLLLAACGDGDGGAADAQAPVADDARRIEVVGDDFAFAPERLSAEAGEDLVIALRSEDTVHDLTIDDLGFQVVARPGATEEGGIRAVEAGTYTFYCSIPGHRGAGMEGTLTVE